MNPDGSALEVFARGLRNTVGFDWDPRTKSSGSPITAVTCSVTMCRPTRSTTRRARRIALRLPYCHAGTIPDPEFGRKLACGEFTASAQGLGPHVAALGMRFYTGNQFPRRTNRVFIAEHGSWNRSTKIGYRVTMVTLEGNKAIRYEPFAEGWLRARRMGATGGRAGRCRWLVARLGRHGRRDLPDSLQGPVDASG
jgi:hypothetical protein